jgi:pilus assembly protein CpaE
MTKAVRTLVVLDPAVPRDDVVSALPTDGVDVVAMIDGFSDVDDALQRTRADMIVVACDHESATVIDVIADARRKRPDRPVVVLCSGAPNGFVRRVFDAGADDIVELPQSAENVRFLIEKAIARRQRPDRDPARTIVVLGPKGGTGKTLTSCNLGVLLASRGHRTVIVDIDLQFGDVGLALGMRPERTIYDLSVAGGTLDAEKVDDYLAHHQSGLRVLLAPSRPDQASSVTVDLLLEVYPILRDEFDYVIVDTPPGFTPEVIATIDNSTDVCMVGTLDTLSLKNTRLGLETLTLMGYPEANVSLVLNRAQTKVGISADDVAQVAGRVPDVLVPSDRDIPRSVNEGLPVALSHPKSDAAKALAELMTRYLPAAAVPESQGRRRLLARKA